MLVKGGKAILYLADIVDIDALTEILNSKG